MFKINIIHPKSILAVLALCLGLLFLFSFCSYASDDNTSALASPSTRASQNQISEDEISDDNTPSNDDSNKDSAGNEAITDEPVADENNNEKQEGTGADDLNGGSTDSSDTQADIPQNNNQSSTMVGWQEKDGYKYYYKKDGTYYKNTFAAIDGKTYRFDIFGHLLYGANKYTNGSYYYSNKNGEVITSAGWVTDENGNKHYILRGGKLYANTRVAIEKSTYFYGFDSISNLIKLAVFKHNGYWYYAGSNGVNQYYSRFVTLNGKTYYVTKGGRLYSGIRVKIGSGNKYYGFNQNAEMFHLKVYSYRGNRYYAASSGINQYYAKFVTIGNKTYYVKNGGALYANARVKIGSGNNYYGFNSLGELYKKAIYYYRGKYYYAGSSGINQYYEKAINFNGKPYYCTKGGVLSTNRFVTANGKSFYAGPNAEALTGWIIRNGYAYYAASDGYIDYKKFGRFTYSNGKEYFSLPGGVLYRDTYILLPEGYCYVDKNCVIDLLKQKENPFSSDLYDKLNGSLTDFSFTITSDRASYYAWNWSYRGMSLIEMYEATGDTNYLDLFVAQAASVLASRDSELGIPSFGNSDLSLPLWSDDGRYSVSGKYRYPYLAHTGMILFPMLMFADDVKNTPALHDKYLNFANIIILATEEALKAHEQYNVKWVQTSTTEGYYWIKDYNNSNSELSNAYNTMITNMSQIYTSCVGLLGKVSANQDMLGRAEMATRYFKNNILMYSSSRDCYYWAYNKGYNPTMWDDISHGYITVISQNILYTRCGINILSSDFFEKLSNTACYTFKYINSSLFTRPYLYPPSTGEQLCTFSTNNQAYSLASLAILSKYDASILTYYADILLSTIAQPKLQVMSLSQIAHLITGFNALTIA